MKIRFCTLLAVALGVVACDRSDDAPKIPLSGEVTALPPGHPAIGTAAQPGATIQGARPMISGAAKVALDSGNTLYKKKAYAAALEGYRRAAALAPGEEAPLIGMMMVANVTGNSRLGDSVTTRLRALNGPLSAGADSLSAAELKDIHAGVRPSPHRVSTAKKL